MIFRKYQQEDLPQILRLFHDTVHSICSGDYTAAQLDAWAPDSFDTDVQKRWHCTLTEHFTVIAEEGLVITDLETSMIPDTLTAFMSIRIISARESLLVSVTAWKHMRLRTSSQLMPLSQQNLFSRKEGIMWQPGRLWNATAFF